MKAADVKATALMSVLVMRVVAANHFVNQQVN